MPRFSRESIKANDALVVINAVAIRKGFSTAHVAIAWVLAQKPWIVPIPGTTKLRNLLQKRALDMTGVEAPPKL